MGSRRPVRDERTKRRAGDPYVRVSGLVRLSVRRRARIHSIRAGKAVTWMLGEALDEYLSKRGA